MPLTTTIAQLSQALKQLISDYQCCFCHEPLTPAHRLPVCHNCHDQLPWAEQTPGSSGEYAAFYYQPPVDRYLLSGKNNNQLDTLNILARLLERRFDTLPTPRPQAIIPVPLHKRRLRQRGFNQSQELIRHTARHLQLPLLTQAVARINHTADQKRLNESERQHNIHGAFRLTTPLTYQHIAIFDDIVTTGATCRELQRILLENGIKKVDIWCCATTKQ